MSADPGAGESTAPARLPVWPVLAATLTTQSLTTLGALALSAVAPHVAADLGLPPAQIGYQVSLVYGGAVISSLAGSGFVHRLGPTRTSQIALWLVAAGCLLSSLGSLPALAAGALIIGFGYGGTNPAASHLLARTDSGRHMNLIFSIKQCGVPVGGMLAGLLIPPITIAVHWRAGLLTCAVLALAVSVMLVRYQAGWDTDRQRDSRLFLSPLAGLQLIWRHHILRWLALCSFAFSAVQLSLVSLLVTYLVTEVHLSLVTAGGLLAIAQMAGAAGRLGWGWLADRLRSGSKALILNGLLAAMAAVATAFVSADWPWLWIAVLVAVFGFCAVGWNGVFIAVIARQAPRESIGLATGATLSITYAGVLVGPSGFAALHDGLGLSYGHGYILMALITLVGVWCMVEARKGIPPR